MDHWHHWRMDHSVTAMVHNLARLGDRRLSVHGMDHRHGVDHRHRVDHGRVEHGVAPVVHGLAGAGDGQLGRHSVHGVDHGLVVGHEVPGGGRGARQNGAKDDLEIKSFN